MPTVSTTYAASTQPTWAAPASPSPQARPARKPARNASPTPVGSTAMTSAAAGSSIGSAPARWTRTPRAPSVVTWRPTLASTSSADQPVLDSIRCDSYSLENKMAAPSIRSRISSPSAKASCWLQSAMNG